MTCIYIDYEMSTKVENKSVGISSFFSQNLKMLNKGKQFRIVQKLRNGWSPEILRFSMKH